VQLTAPSAASADSVVDLYSAWLALTSCHHFLHLGPTPQAYYTMLLEMAWQEEKGTAATAATAAAAAAAAAAATAAATAATTAATHRESQPSSTNPLPSSRYMTATATFVPPPAPSPPAPLPKNLTTFLTGWSTQRCGRSSEKAAQVRRTPYTHILCTIHSYTILCTIHHTPYTIHHTPYTIHSYNIHHTLIHAYTHALIHAYTIHRHGKHSARRCTGTVVSRSMSTI
jgi:hypothetical protein